MNSPYSDIVSIAVPPNFSREEIFELGRRAPYHRFTDFPVEITEEIHPFPPIPTVEKRKIFYADKKIGIQDPPPGLYSQVIPEFPLDMFTVHENVVDKLCDCPTLTLMQKGCICGGK